MNVLHDLLAERGTLLIDGAMGTELFARGLGSGDPPEMWNVDHPDRVTAVHADYINAIDSRVGMPDGASRAMLDQLASGASIACSTGSQAVVGVTPDNADEVLAGGLDLEWSGPPGVVAMSALADTTLSF